MKSALALVALMSASSAFAKATSDVVVEYFSGPNILTITATGYNGDGIVVNAPMEIQANMTGPHVKKTSSRGVRTLEGDSINCTHSRSGSGEFVSFVDTCTQTMRWHGGLEGGIGIKATVVGKRSKGTLTTSPVYDSLDRKGPAKGLLTLVITGDAAEAIRDFQRNQRFALPTVDSYFCFDLTRGKSACKTIINQNGRSLGISTR